MNAPAVSPRAWYASKATRFANPPTKKKMGITWRNHVASQSHEVTPIALVDRIEPRSQMIIAIVQWPITTDRMLTARRKSTYRSRVDGGSVGQLSQACRHDPS